MSGLQAAGFLLGARIGVLGNDWLRASYGGIVVMMAAGTVARRSEALRLITRDMTRRL